MSTNEKPFSEINWGGQNPEGVTTGWNQSLAGAGRHHWTERRARGAAIQQGMQGMQPPRVVLPLRLDEIQSFVDEVRPPHRNVARDMVVGGVLGAALVHVIRNRRAR